MIYALAAFATYRIAYMVVNEAGPFGLAEMFRTWVYGRTEDGSLWQSGLACIKCTSWWVAWVVSGLLRPSNVIEFLLFSQGVAGLAILVHHTVVYLEMIPQAKVMAELMNIKE